MDGIYKSDYNNTPIYSTHFEATSARKASPSFDQPDLKAKFILKVKAPEDFIVLSNSSVKEKIGTTYTFNTTKPMSTYLVAFVVGKLDFIQTTSNNNIPIKIYADKEDLFTANFALKVAKEALDFFERYFEIK
ncbi:glutamyl aminopeptidase [Vairimorpha apis BRL 01]|uniref:Glutamyl aminopeptidase n=1 Tax=Vairimorpha apis BRL 01 TaxID=1037528 RepID=T0MFU2_9MICR|nr:glutamyl aminopeptidase [Vairimorpha apis BRL 01]